MCAKSTHNLDNSFNFLTVFLFCFVLRFPTLCIVVAIAKTGPSSQFFTLHIIAHLDSSYLPLLARKKQVNESYVYSKQSRSSLSFDGCIESQCCYMKELPIRLIWRIYLRSPGFNRLLYFLVYVYQLICTNYVFWSIASPFIEDFRWCCSLYIKYSILYCIVYVYSFL